MEELVVHPRIHGRHPEISEQAVLDAWNGGIRSVPQLAENAGEVVVLGCDAKGRLVEMVAKRLDANSWLVFHALTPPTKKTLVELGLRER